MTCGRRVRQGCLSVLLADGSRRFLRLLLRFLEAQDQMAMEVVGMASSGAAALVTAVVRRPQVIVTDLDMPDLSGWGLLSRLRRELPEAGIIILTLLNPKIYRATALRMGADELVIKTNLESDLLPAIQRMAPRFSSGQPRREPVSPILPVIGSRLQ